MFFLCFWFLASLDFLSKIGSKVILFFFISSKLGFFFLSKVCAHTTISKQTLRPLYHNNSYYNS